MSVITMIEPAGLEVQTSPAAALPVAQTVSPAFLLQLAVQQNADLAKLEKLMDLHERWEANKARQAFVQAMAAFKADAPSITKEKTADFATRAGRTVYKYADLADVVSKIAPALAMHGLSHDWSIQTEGKLIQVTCTLTHVMGHSKSVTLPAFADDSGGKNAIQAVASAVSYLEKYTLLAVTGLAAAGIDDDGNGAGNSTSDSDIDAPAGDGQTAEHTADAGRDSRLPEMPAAHFEANFPTWRNGIVSGRKTPGEVLTTLTSRYTLTAAQKSRIRECGNAVRQPAH